MSQNNAGTTGAGWINMDSCERSLYYYHDITHSTPMTATEQNATHTLLYSTYHRLVHIIPVGNGGVVHNEMTIGEKLTPSLEVYYSMEAYWCHGVQKMVLS